MIKEGDPGLHLNYVSNDQYIQELEDVPLVLNNLEFSDQSVLETVKDSLYTQQQENESIDSAASCRCGEITDSFKKGEICEACGTKVTGFYDKREPRLWAKTLPGIEKFISPGVWYTISSLVSTNYDVLRWISDTSYNPPNLPSFILKMGKYIKNFRRSYNFLYRNMSEILLYLSNSSILAKKREKFLMLRDSWNEDKSKMSSNYVGFINKFLFVLEDTNKGKYIDFSLGDYLSAAIAYGMGINKLKNRKKKDDFKSRLTSRLISSLGSAGSKVITKYLVKKEGALRKNVYGARFPFTFRTVITSISDPVHRFNEIHVPWKVGVTTYRPHILNKLYKMGYSFEEADLKLFTAVNKFDPVIEEILNEMIANSPDGKGIPILIGRNPSLDQGSLQLVYITKFKTNVNDTTTSISILITKPMNADFDGDEGNKSQIIDFVTLEMAKVFDLSYTIPSLDSVGGVSGNLALPSPSVSTLTRYLKAELEEEEDTIDFMTV